MIKLFFMTFFISCRAFSFFSSDTAFIIDLVSTSASQLNELEKLVSNTEKYTERMREYNELAQDKIYQSERIIYLAEELSAKRNIKGLGEINAAIRNLKLSIGDLKGQLKEYTKIKNDEDRTDIYIKENKKLNEKVKRRAEKQVDNSINAKTVGRANQLSAQNTALILENQVRMEETQLQILNQLNNSNHMIRDDLESKKANELLKKQTYGQIRGI